MEEHKQEYSADSRNSSLLQCSGRANRRINGVCLHQSPKLVLNPNTQLIINIFRIKIFTLDHRLDKCHIKLFHKRVHSLIMCIFNCLY